MKLPVPSTKNNIIEKAKRFIERESFLMCFVHNPHGVAVQCHCFSRKPDDALDQVMKTVSGYNVSYLIVDDNSPDGTRQLVEAYQRTHADVSLISGKKEGLGKALLRGLSHAVDRMGADIILQMDADLSHDPRVIPEFLKALERGADFVVGSRYIPGGSIPANWGIHRKVQSIMGNGLPLRMAFRLRRNNFRNKTSWQVEAVDFKQLSD